MKRERRRREGPPWSAVMVLIKQKTLGAMHNRAEKIFQPGSFDQGVLTITVSPEWCERASSLGRYIKMQFPEVTEVRFVAATESAA
jgi:hypothetical protein